MIDERLNASIMPGTVLLNDFVTNEKNCNYEFYLLEYVNVSQYFQKKIKIP